VPDPIANTAYAATGDSIFIFGGANDAGE